MMRSLRSRHAAALAVTLLLIPSVADTQQRESDHDGTLLENIAARRFDAIPRSQAALTQLLVAFLAFDKSPCEIAGTSPELERDAKAHRELAFELMRSHNGIILTAGFTQAVHPTTFQVAAWIDTHGCKHERTQQLMKNMFGLSATRPTPADWGLGGQAVASRTPPPRQAPAASRPAPPATEASPPPTITRRPNVTIQSPARTDRRRDDTASAGQAARPAPRQAAPPPASAAAPVPAMTRDEITAWLTRCREGTVPPGADERQRQIWCGCSVRAATMLQPDDRQGILRDFERTLARLREEHPRAGAYLERCGMAIDRLRQRERE